MMWHIPGACFVGSKKGVLCELFRNRANADVFKQQCKHATVIASDEFIEGVSVIVASLDH